MRPKTIQLLKRFFQRNGIVYLNLCVIYILSLEIQSPQHIAIAFLMVSIATISAAQSVSGCYDHFDRLFMLLDMTAEREPGDARLLRARYKQSRYHLIIQLAIAVICSMCWIFACVYFLNVIRKESMSFGFITASTIAVILGVWSSWWNSALQMEWEPLLSKRLRGDRARGTSGVENEFREYLVNSPD